MDERFNRKRLIKRWFPLILLIFAFFLFFYFHLHHYLTFESLREHQQLLLKWTHEYYPITVSAYILIYIFAVAISIPGAVYITLTGGFLFGPIATLYVVISATLGATLLYLAVRSAVGDWVTQKATGWVAKMKTGFQQNAFNYLLFLRLVPLFPFWAINMVAAVLAIPLRTFIVATGIGIIPGSFVYVMVGNSLNVVFKTHQAPNLSIIFSPSILLPLLGLALLSLLPIIYQRWKGKSDGKNHKS